MTMSKIPNLIQCICFLCIYCAIIVLAYHLMSVFIPKVVYGKWISYILWGLAAGVIEIVVPIIASILGGIVSRIYRSKLIVKICIAFTFIAFCFSEIHLWQYIFALYFASFWEYFWGIIFTLVLAVYYTQIFLCVVHVKKLFS